ncbi:MAG: hypothetical protein ABI639_12570 [Thermoanaerobaculia bacterium]
MRRSRHHRLLSCLEGAGDRAIYHRVRDQLLGDLAERLLTLPGDAVNEALILLWGRHCGAGYITGARGTSRVPLGGLL